eukprot:TRINITY_DN15119_c0_g1_i1.p1 TRINITY_DN15119_c0_g1~~TRINITY_DN15119_c0_g1_i1.p1  ORF type:complete len:429 (-),score=86.64 TRINITY_DN15119_c0_g1_i1:379-1665(-)
MMGWQPPKVQLPADLSQALLSALRAAASRAGARDTSTADSAAKGSKPAFVVGEDVQYWSSTNQEWLKACVLSVSKDAKGRIKYNLDCKSRVDASQLRAVSASCNGHPGSSDAIKAAPVTANDGAEGDGNTKDDSDGYELGASVECWNLEHKRWQVGMISRQYQHSGITVYDVACKQSVLRMLPASRLRLSRLQVGDLVEYWSKTAKIWLQATVVRLLWSKQVCDLDIKKGAPLANVRKLEAPPKQGTAAASRSSEDAAAAAAQGRAKDAAAGAEVDEEEGDEDLEDLLDLDPDWEDQMWEAIQAEDEGEGFSDEEQKLAPRRKARADSRPRSKTGAARSRSRSRECSQSPLMRRRPISAAQYATPKGAGPTKGKGKGKKNPLRRGEKGGKGVWGGRDTQRYREATQDGRYSRDAYDNHSNRWRELRRR